MNYRHLYHAGNFSDVFKHIVLISLIDFLKQKTKPFCYLETHAGAGLYHLKSEETEKTKEYQNGILKLFTAKNQTQEEIPDIVKVYLQQVQAQGFPNFYPGSPLIAASQLRAEDRLILMELQATEIKTLKTIFSTNRQAAIHQQDGYLGLKAFLPPKERRGLILIDPPFEKPTEWQDLLKNIGIAYQRFSSGVYAIWYPLKDKTAVQNFQKKLKLLYEENLVITELSVYPEDLEVGLVGCGMAIINPPWKWKETFTSVLPWLWENLASHRQGTYRII